MSPIHRVLDVGNCAPDHGAIRDLIETHFAAEVRQAHGLEDAQAMLSQDQYSLVLVNRKLDQDYSDGLELIRTLRGNPQFSAIPMMLVSNYPEHQRQAIAAGAVPGVGKKTLDSPETIDRLRNYLIPLAS